MLTAQSAFASYWIECKVKATVVSKDDGAAYSIKIHNAKITDGHEEEGKPCMMESKGKTIKIVSVSPLPEGKDVTLRYRFSNGWDGDKSEWALWKTTWRDFLL